MPTPGDLSRAHLLVADGADVVVRGQLLVSGVRQAVYLVDGRPSFHEDRPAGFGVAPNIEVGVDAHHDRPDGTSALEQQDPGPVEEEEDPEAELDGVAEGPDVVDVVVQLLPEGLPSSVQEKQGVDGQGDEHLDDDLDAERADGQQPGGGLLR